MAAERESRQRGDPEGRGRWPSASLEVEFNRPHLAIEVCGIDRRWQPATAWVDTGGGPLLVGGRLAGRLGLSTGAELDTRPGGRRLAALESLPGVRCCGREMEPLPGRAYAVVGAERVDPGQRAEVFLPAYMLAGQRLVLDYPRKGGTLLPPADSRWLAGCPVPCQVPSGSGFPRTEIEVAGETLGLLVDTGAPCSMISAAVLNRWEAIGFPLTTGAAGAAAMGTTMDPQARMVRVPQLRWGELTLEDVLFVERQEGTFENWMSGLIGRPVTGALAGNVFAQCRLDLTRGDSTRLSIDCATTRLGGDLRTVGLCWRRENGTLLVQGVSGRAADETKAAVNVGDELVAIDGQPTSKMTNHELTTALSGQVGALKELLLKPASSGEKLPARGQGVHPRPPTDTTRVPVVDLL